MAGPQRGFGPPPEVTRYFTEKELAPRFSWLDVWGEEHASAFTVAKATELELLAAFRESIAGAIEKGQGFETWRKDLQPELERLGWWGKRVVEDPAGGDRPATVDFSRPRRLRTIFWSNMNAARSAGQWDRAQRTKAALPYILYVRTSAADPRPEHLAWAGTILPVDDPFWRSHWPPNGWGCKCTVRQVTARERDRLLGGPGHSGTPPPTPTRTFRNRRTGVVTEVPEGIDPGWHTNPGLAAERRRAVADALADRVAATAGAGADAGILRNRAAVTVREVVASEAFALHHREAVALRSTRRRIERELIAGGVRRAEADAEVHRRSPWTHVNMPVAVMPLRLETIRRGLSPAVTVSDAAIAHSYRSHPTRAEDWAIVQRALDGGEVHVADDGKRIWAFVAEAGRDWMLVLSDVAAGWRVLTFYPPAPTDYRARQRQRAGRRVVVDEGK